MSSYVLKNDRGTRATLIDHGATLVALELGDGHAGTTDVVLGFDSLEPYLANAPFFGATVGRYANRIAHGKFTLDGNDYNVAINDPPNHLHGGPGGFHRVLWQAELGETPEGPGVCFRYTSPAGEEGYPGTLTVAVRYTLTSDDALDIAYEASTDSATLVNLAHHSYFNLAGPGDESIEGHLLRIAADAYTPIDATAIPTGELASVQGTPFDFRKPTAIGLRIREANVQLEYGQGYDHNFVVAGWDGSLREVAEVVEPRSGRSLRVLSTEPGLQFYSGNKLAGTRGKGGLVYAARAGFCLEAQHFPNSPNQASFPSTLLRPGQRYEQITRYVFARI